MTRSTVFSNLLVKLGNRVHVLEDTYRDLSRDALEKELNTCIAYAKKLYVHADRYNVDIGNYYHQLVDVTTCLNRVQVKFEKSKRSWWKKALYGVAHIINIVTSILGLGPLLPTGMIKGLLPPGLG